LPHHIFVPCHTIFLSLATPYFCPLPKARVSGNAMVSGVAK